MQTVNVFDFMFTPCRSGVSKRLLSVAKVFFDFDFRRYEPDQLGDIAAKMLMARQAIDHAFRTKFGVDPESLPKKFEDVPGAPDMRSSFGNVNGVGRHDDGDEICW